MKGEKRNKAVGVKGKSGRKKLTDEVVRAAVINKSWGILLDFLELPNLNILDLAEKRKIALEIAKKTIPQNIDLTTKGKEINHYSDEQLRTIAERICSNSRATSQRTSD